MRGSKGPGLILPVAILHLHIAINCVILSGDTTARPIYLYSAKMDCQRQSVGREFHVGILQRDPDELSERGCETAFEDAMNEHVQTATTAPLFDPLSPEFIRDPYPSYARLRTTDPMHVTPFGAYLASRHAEASLVLRDKRLDRKSTRLNSSHRALSRMPSSA